MNKNLRWKLIAILAVIVICAWAIYPPSQERPAGLDLKGGVHLVLQVQTDDALRLETETEMVRLRDDLVKGGVSGATAESVSPTEFRINGVPADKDAQVRAAATAVEATYNRESGVNGSYTFRMKPNIANQMRNETVDQAIRTIERRVNDLGVAEPIVARQGAVDQIIVQLPGVSDVTRAKEIIRSTSLLELKEVAAGARQLGGSAEGQRRRSARRGDPAGRRRPRHRGRFGRLLPGAQDSRRQRPRPAQRGAQPRREQPARGEVLAEARRRHQVRHLDRREHRQVPGDRARPPRRSARR